MWDKDSQITCCAIFFICIDCVRYHNSPSDSTIRYVVSHQKETQFQIQVGITIWQIDIPDIKTSETIKIRITALTQWVKFYINDVLVGEVFDISIKEGYLQFGACGFGGVFIEKLALRGGRLFPFCSQKIL